MNTNRPPSDQALPEAALPPPHRLEAPLGAAVVFTLALATYGATALLTGHTESPQHTYFDHLAQAFLNGRLHLVDPPGHHDLTPFEGRWYLAFPPLPALLMLPWIAGLGVTGFNAVAFSIVCGAASVAVVWLLLAGLARNGWIRLAFRDRVWLTVLFAFSTVHWQVAVEGSVWFLGHTCTLLFALLAVWLATISPSPWLSSTALAIAALGRPHIVLMAPLLAGLAMQRVPEPSRSNRRRHLVRWSVAAAAPIAISAAALAGYNYARFGDPFEFGYKRQKVEASLLGPLHEHGQFSFRHIPRNFRTMVTSIPALDADTGWPVPDDHGLSLFITTPALLFALRAKRRDALTKGAWLAVWLTLIPLLLYYNPGWRQFGYRFALDFIAPAIVLTAVGVSPRAPWPFQLLVCVGVLVNLWGVVWWYTDLL